MPKPKPQSPSRPEALQTIDPTALSTVSGGARSGRTAGSGGGGGGGGSGSGSDDALIGALTGILDSLGSLSKQSSPGFGAEEMMLFMMMMQQRSNAVQVVQPALPAIYMDGTKRVF